MPGSSVLHDRLARLAEHGERPALVAFEDGGTTCLKFPELADQVRRLAAGLVSGGVGHGEAVAICGANSPAWVIVALATIMAGAAVVPLDSRLEEHMLGEEIRRSGCRRMFVSGRLRPAVERALARHERPEILLLDGDEGGERGWKSLLADAGATFPALSGDDLAALFFTSGTTGPPKAVPLTHENLMSNLQGLLDAGLVNARERALLPLPLHHVYPFTVGMLAPLIGGASVVLPAGIGGPEIQRALRDGGATVVIGIPRLLEALLAAVERRIAKRGRLPLLIFKALLNFSVLMRRRFGWRVGRVLFHPLRRAVAPQLRLFASGGAPLDPDVAWALEGLGWEVLAGYGLTETSPIVSFNTSAANRIGTVGRSLPGIEVRIARPDETGLGEIQVRGPSVFAGYKDDPEATAKAFEEGGWFRTKDLGCLEDGYLKVGARLDETIVLGAGKKIFPEEVEAVYQRSDVVHEMAVLERGGKLVALVVPEATAARSRHDGVHEVIAAELRRLGRNLAPHQRITDFAVTRNPLPRTTLRKLRRHMLPAIYDQVKSGAEVRAGEDQLSAADRGLLEAETARRVWEWLKGRFPDRPVTMDAELQADLGIDSLDVTTLTLELADELGVTLGESSVTRAITVRDLLEEILAAEQGNAEQQEGAAPGAEQLRWLEPPGVLAEVAGACLFAANRIVLRLLFRLRVEHRERAPDRGPCILAPNHASFLDAFALAAALRYSQARQTYWAGITLYLFRTTWQRLFSRVIHALPIDPARAPASSLALGAEAVRRGKILVWFPEGARTRTGALQPLMPGLGRIAAATRTPIVPVYIAGTFEAWPIGRKYPRLRPLTVHFGDLLVPDAPEGESEEALAERITAQLRDRLERLVREDASAP